jgi:lipopolysaccharide export system protein LptA
LRLTHQFLLQAALTYRIKLTKSIFFKDHDNDVVILTGNVIGYSTTFRLKATQLIVAVSSPACELHSIKKNAAYHTEI